MTLTGRKVVAFGLAATLAFAGVAGCGSNANDSEGSAAQQSAEKTEAKAEPEKRERPDAVAVFVEKYNDGASTPITDVADFDAKDKANPFYRVQFRLPAYKNTIARSGKIGDVTICMVQGWQGDSWSEGNNVADQFVVYAFGADDSDASKQAVKDVLMRAAGIVEPEHVDHVAEAFDNSTPSIDACVVTGLRPMDDYAHYPNEEPAPVNLWQGQLANTTADFAK